jgi:hypothetical protein
MLAAEAGSALDTSGFAATILVLAAIIQFAPH